MPYPQLTIADVVSRLQERLGAAATVFWRADELTRYIKQSLRTFNALTGYWKSRVTISNSITGTVANQVWYSVPGTMTSSMRLLFNGKPLELSSIWDLDHGRANWESETTTDGGDVPTEPTSWAPAGLNLVAIWPADAAGGNSLVADGIATTPTTTFDLGQEELVAILDYAEHLCQFKEGGAEFQASLELYKSFLQFCAERNAMLMASAKFRSFMGTDESEESDRQMVEPKRIGAR